MSMRDHGIFRIEYKYRQQIRISDGGGGSDFAGYDPNLTADEWTGVFPSKAIAKVWAKRRLEHVRDAELVAVIWLHAVDACIIEHQY